mgnify:CR=1 FL=1
MGLKAPKGLVTLAGSVATVVPRLGTKKAVRPLVAEGRKRIPLRVKVVVWMLSGASAFVLRVC